MNLNEIGPETKGTPAYTENAGTLYANNLSVWGDSPKFQPAATYDNMETSMYARKDKNQGEGWRYQHNYSGDPWPGKTTQVGFYLNMPATLLESSSLNIKGRSGGAFTFDYTSPTTASKQEDLLFAYRAMSKEEHMGYLPNGAPVLFNHALTGVKFAIGNDLETENDVAITSVTFVGLKNKATNITMTPVGAKVDDTENEYTDKIDHYTSAGTVDWSSATADPAKNEISETYEGVTTYATGAGSFGTGKGNYPQSFSAAGNKNNLGSSDGSQIFWLIPQTFAATSAVKLRIAYTYGNNSGEWTIDFGSVLGQKGVEWKAGELRTYTIKIDEVKVTIRDEVEVNGELKDGFTGSVKKNVVIKNTGNTDAYIRAALIGQWYDAVTNLPVFGYVDMTGGDIKTVPSWYEDQFVNENHSHGAFVGLPGYLEKASATDAGTRRPDLYNGWQYDSSDGYYYYTGIVKPGDETGYYPEASGDEEPQLVTQKLFTTYTVGTSPAVNVGGEVRNVYFVLEIATQAISAKKLDGSQYATYTEAWDNAYDQVTEVEE